MILAASQHQARERLAEHLTHLGKAATTTQASELIAEIPVERVAVIW